MARTDDTVYTLLVRVTALAQREATGMLFEMGVSPFEQWLLEEIPYDGDACASELAVRLEVPTSTVTRGLRRLEQYGYVTLRKGVFRDGRILRAIVTDRGALVRDCARGFEHDIDRLLCEGLPPSVLVMLLQGLVHMHMKGTALALPQRFNRLDAQGAPDRYAARDATDDHEHGGGPDEQADPVGR